MDDPSDPSVRMLEGSRPRLRDGLRFSFQEFSGTRYAMVEDPLTSRHYRVGIPEYFLLRQLDGRCTWSEAVARASLLSGRHALTPQEATHLLAWLTGTGLADFGGAKPRPEPSEAPLSANDPIRNIPRLLNLIFLRIPLGRPDPLFARAAPLLGWACGPVGLYLWLLAVLVGGLALSSKWTVFLHDAEGVLGGRNWLWLGTAWILLKCLHEFWHGIVCRHYGGSVREAGIFLVLFVPMGYVDATSSWSFPDKWRRIHVALAGVAIELFAASLAAVLWAGLEPGVARTLAYNVVIMAGVTTILFNANPLLRFDGYYVLSDLLEIPNLYMNGARYLLALAKRFLLGLRSAALPDFSEREALITAVYGACSFVWRVLLYTSLFGAAFALFRGAGAALAIVAALAMAVPAAARAFRYLREGEGLEAPSARIYGPRLAAALTVLCLILFLPLRPLVSAPAVLQIKDNRILRVECPGFLNTVSARHNETVKEGQTVAVLSNPDETVALRKLQLRVDHQEVKTHRAYSRGDAASLKRESAALEAFRIQLKEKKSYLASLRMTAPVDGTLIAPRLEELLGNYLRPGEPLAAVGGLPAQEVQIAAAQGDIAHFRAQAGRPIQVKVMGRAGRFDAVLESVAPRAARDIPHAALSSLAGGPLSVVRRTEGRTARTSDPAADFELLSPVFTAKARINGEAATLAAGETARVRFRSPLGLPAWKRLYQALARRVEYLRTRRTTA